MAIAADAQPSTTDDLATAGYEEKLPLASGDRLLFVSDGYGSAEGFDITCTNELRDFLGLTSGAMSVDGLDAKIELASSGAGSTTDGITYTIAGNVLQFSDSTGTLGAPITIDPGTVGTIYTDLRVTTNTAAATAGTNEYPTVDMVLSVLDAGPMDLQIGANEGQIMSVRIPKVTPATLGIDRINIGTADGAQEAVGLLDDAINTVSGIRSKLGAYQNRLEHSISNLDVTQENMTESLSRIEDVDMAEEMAEYTQKNVLAQAGTSMLAQANQRPQTVLSLLQQ
jgi:flagellin